MSRTVEAGTPKDKQAKDPDTVKGFLTVYEQAGCDELILFPASGDPEQVSLLADAARL